MNSYSCWVRPICLCLMHSVIRCPLLFCGGRSEAQRGRHRVCPACGYVASRPALCARARLPALRRAPSEYFRREVPRSGLVGKPTRDASPLPHPVRRANCILDNIAGRAAFAERAIRALVLAPVTRSPLLLHDPPLASRAQFLDHSTCRTGCTASSSLLLSA